MNADALMSEPVTIPRAANMDAINELHVVAQQLESLTTIVLECGAKSTNLYDETIQNGVFSLMDSLASKVNELCNQL